MEINHVSMYFFNWINFFFYQICNKLLTNIFFSESTQKLTVITKANPASWGISGSLSIASTTSWLTVRTDTNHCDGNLLRLQLWLNSVMFGLLSFMFAGLNTIVFVCVLNFVLFCQVTFCEVQAVLQQLHDAAALLWLYDVWPRQWNSFNFSKLHFAILLVLLKCLTVSNKSFSTNRMNLVKIGHAFLVSIYLKKESFVTLKFFTVTLLLK